MQDQTHSGGLPHNASLFAQAAHWWAVLHDEEASASDRQQFNEWLMRSPERIEAYLQVAQLAGALRSGEVRWPKLSVEELVRQALQAPAEAVALPVGRTLAASPVREAAPATDARRSTFARAWLVAGAAASVLLAAIGIGLWMTGSESQQYRTAVGEQHSLQLEDGSLVTLNTATKIEVAVSREARRVRLLEGEALFQVAPDARRPFDVESGDVVIRALGTRFNVDRRSSRTTVTVLEGKVLVKEGDTAVPLGVAERLVVGDSAPLRAEKIADPMSAVSWKERRLIFERRALADVAEEFNRYNRQQIVIDDVRLGAQEVTGVFDANDADALLAFLRGFDARIDTAPDGTLHVRTRD